MPKIAILVSGEYRKLDVTRKTMPFLSDPNADIYVSTWDKTIYSSPKIHLHVEEEVTKERIEKDLGRSATIKIDKHDSFIEKRYNSKMINRWKAGLEMIDQRGVNYDYVVIVRPDLFFTSAPEPILSFENAANGIGFAWATSLHLKKLPDVLFFSTYQNMKNLLDALTIEEWDTAEETDWHIWWYNFVADRYSIANIDNLSYFTFCRYWAKPEYSFQEVLDVQHDWRDLRLLYDRDRWGIKHVLKAWPKEIAALADERWKKGDFNKYGKAVIFDLDGVLVSTDVLHKDCLLQALKEILDIDGKEYHYFDQKSMMSTREKVKKLQDFMLFSDEKLEQVLVRKDELFLEKIPTLSVGQNVFQVLRHLKRNGIRTAIASNSRLVNIKNVLKATKTEIYFDIIVSAEEVPNRKPAPDILFEVYKRLGVDGNKTLFIEDSQEGVDAGLQSLSKTIMIGKPEDLNLDLFKDWL